MPVQHLDLMGSLLFLLTGFHRYPSVLACHARKPLSRAVVGLHEVKDGHGLSIHSR